MKYIWEPSRTFAEFLILPNLTKRNHSPANVSLSTPLVKFKKGSKPEITLDIPFMSSAMQSVSGEKMAIALSQQGGISCVYCNQTIEDQSKMIERIKKAGAKVGAAVNTHDFKERIPALVKAGADILVVDASDGYSEWQGDVIKFVRDTYGDKVKIGAGNVVEKNAFQYLVDAGADFIKVGIGGGSICITREQKGIGRGQASALIDVVEARDEHFKKTGTYIPLCSDGGIVHDNHIIVALAMGADFVMMGRYFARFEESNTEVITIGDKKFKEYWGEGSNRAQNWQRYGTGKLKFEEGVDSLVPYVGTLSDNMATTLGKIRATLCNCGSLTLPEFFANTRLTLVSPSSIREGGAHDVEVR